MLTEEQKEALRIQRDESEAQSRFVDSYELALIFFSEESSLPPNLRGLAPNELRIQLNNLTFEQTDGIVSNLRPQAGLSPEQQSSWIWIRGARDINNGEAAYADFIRGYTEQQIDFRSIPPSPSAEPQTISNGIARNVINDLIDSGNLPPILDVGLKDASVVINDAANGDPAAWAGNPLFLFLGEDVFLKANLLHDTSAQSQLANSGSNFRVINTDVGDTYDLLLSFKVMADIGGSDVGRLFFETIGEIWSRPGDSSFNLVNFPSNFRTFIADGYNGFVTQSDNFLRNAYGASGIDELNLGVLVPIPIIGQIASFAQELAGFFGNVSLGNIELELDRLQNNGELQSPVSGVVHGADGNDTLIGSSELPIFVLPRTAFLDGGSGDDLADYSRATEELTVTIDELGERTEAEFIGQVTSSELFGAIARSDNLYNIERILGSPQNDEFEIKTFKESLQEIDGGDGEEDTLNLSEINDSIIIDLPAGQLLSNASPLAIRNFEFFEGTTQDDIFIADDQTTSIIGGDGEDTADFSNLSSPLRLNLDPGLFGSSDVSLESIERVIGTPQNDEINGSGERETFEGGAGDDTINGGSSLFGLLDGTDSSVYEGTLDEYDIEFLSDGTVRITDRVGSRDGSDTLENIEQAIFSDTTVNLSPGQDVAFVIDTTSSMEDDIDAVKVRASEIINSIFEGEGGFLDSRIAVVGYNDPGTNTFLSFTDQPRVDDRKTAALNAINSISVSGGGDPPEAVNAGLLRALSGGAGEWREEAIARRIILFGDAPPKDTQLRGQVAALASNVNASISGSSLSSLSIAGDIETTNIADNLAVTRFALQTDAPTTTPVEIFTILIGNDSETAADFQSLATATGGQSFNALDASEIVDVIITAIQASPDDNNTPFDGISITTPIPNNLGRPQNTFNNGFYHLTELDDTGIPAEFAETPILALAGNDNLTGTEGRNYISGDQGSDTLSGLGGNDSLFGGQASDLIDGGTGDDLVWGSSDNDRLNGGDGNDSMRGGRDNDVLTGDLGNDTLWGDSGQDILVGGPGNDIFVIATESNVITPIQQADVIADFEVGVDIIGLANNLLLDRLTFEPVNLQLDAGLTTPSTAIRLDNNYLAIVQGVVDENVFATNTNFAMV